MDRNEQPHDENTPLDDSGRLRRIDANPPYGSTFPDKVKHFRELLAELIARQILAERRGPKNSDNKKDP